METGKILGIAIGIGFILFSAPFIIKPELYWRNVKNNMWHVGKQDYDKIKPHKNYFFWTRVCFFISASIGAMLIYAALTLPTS